MTPSWSSAGAAGLSDETLRRTAGASHAEYGFYGVSVFLALDMPVAELCASIDALRRYSMIQESTAGDAEGRGVRAAGDRRPTPLRRRTARPRRPRPFPPSSLLRASSAQPGAVVDWR
jgi:hypothetical protein